MQAILGKKIGMTSVFNEAGKQIPVTAIEVGPCQVVQVKTLENDGYEAVQVGYMEQKAHRVNKPLTGHFSKAGVNPTKVLKEFRFDNAASLAVGATFDISIFNAGDKVEVVGISKGKGFQGTVKRHGMRLQGASHGTHESHRGPGSIGNSTWPSRVWKGKRMAGRMGCDQVTVKNLQIVKVIADQKIILVKGSVPGSRNSILKISKQEA